MPDPMSDPTSGPIGEPTGGGGVGTAAPDVAAGDPALWPATRLAAAIRRRELGSEELLDHYLERIGRLNPAINAVVTLDEERARAEARTADRATVAGGPLPPLHGLPVTIKDALATAGLRSTGGATELAEHVPTVDAPVVASLRRAGAIVFGKTNLPLSLIHI